jgi:hypothetical protein
MGRTERWSLVALIALLLVSSVLPAVAASAPGGAREVNPSESPVVFAERITASHDTRKGSMQNVIELIVLATVCAIGVAFYSSASSGRDDTQVSMRGRRR